MQPICYHPPITVSVALKDIPAELSIPWHVTTAPLCNIVKGPGSITPSVIVPTVSSCAGSVGVSEQYI